MIQRECVCITIVIFKVSFPKSCSDPAKLVGTMDTLWEWIVWDMNCLFDNIYEALDPLGKPFERARHEILPDGYFCFVYSALGDMDHYQKELGLPNQANFDPNPACGHCTANKSTHNWFDFQPGSTWRASLPRARPSYHTIHDIKGFTTLFFTGSAEGRSPGVPRRKTHPTPIPTGEQTIEPKTGPGESEPDTPGGWYHKPGLKPSRLILPGGWWVGPEGSS